MNMIFCVLNTYKNGDYKQKIMFNLIDKNFIEYITVATDSSLRSQIIAIKNICKIEINESIIQAIECFYENYRNTYCEVLGNENHVDSYYLLKLNEDGSQFLESRYSVFNYNYTIKINGMVMDKCIKTFKYLRPKISHQYNAYLMKELVKDNIDVFLPYELLKDVLTGMFQTLTLRNMLLNQSLFKLAELNSRVLDNNISVKLDYPSKCLFDLHGNTVNSRFLIQNGIFKDFIHYTDETDSVNKYCDMVLVDNFMNVTGECVDLFIEIQNESKVFDYLAILEESILAYDAGTQNVVGVISLCKDNHKYLKYIKINGKDFLNEMVFFKDESKLGENEKETGVIVKL